MLQEVSSKQLQPLQSTNSISEFYHLHLHTPHHYAITTSDSIPSMFLPLIQKYDTLFQEPNSLPPLRTFNYSIHLEPSKTG